jgi:iron complex transport system substrate-binding protein
LDVERLAALAPDLIVTQAQCDVCAVRYADVIAAVEAHAGLRQARVVDLNPTTLGEVFRDIERVADAAGVPDTGRAVVSELAQRVEAVCRSAASRPRLRVACIEWISPLMLAGNWIPELIEIAGGTQPFTTAGAASTTCEWAALAQFDPEVIVLMPCGFPLERTLREAPALFELAGWNDLAAVRAGAVLAADGNAYFNRSGPRLVDSLEILADAISGRGLREGATARIACASARR